MSYEEKAFEVIKKSIKSAIFIDEKAKEFYSDELIDENIVEHTLSINLHNSFKKEGVSLAVHKFRPADIDNEKLKKYLFKSRDMVLLDWELEDNGGEAYSLSLLSEIVNSNHINFCCVYSLSHRFDKIFSNILSYFSGLEPEESNKIKNEFGGFEEGLNKISDSFNFSSNDFIEKTMIQFAEIGLSEDLIKKFFQDLNLDECILKIIKTFGTLQKSAKKEFAPTLISYERDSLVINNTIIFILKKQVDTDVNTDEILKRITQTFVSTENNYVQLLGLEMQSIFDNEGSFINENLLNVTKETIISHRNNLKDKNKTDIPFKTLVKNVLIEHSSLKLRTAKLSLLEDSFLDEESALQTTKPTDEEIAYLNVFYNSVNVKSIREGDLLSVNFGDVFIDDEGRYYICITALCDCLNPNKIKHNYYFVLGEELDVKEANKLGDSAFISYLPGNIAVSWVLPDLSKPEKVKKGELSDEQHLIAKQKAEIESLKAFRYRPAYIKPKLLNLADSKIRDNKVIAREITNEIKGADIKEDLPHYNFKYITTIRPNYTQRIANHAFAHPVRVGVDFVKR